MTTASSTRDAYWTLPAAQLIEALGSSGDGLAQIDADQRLAREGPNRLQNGNGNGGLTLLRRQLGDPLVMILLLAALVSGLVGDLTDACIVGLIVLLSAGFGFVQEYRAAVAMQRLRGVLALRCTVLRDGVTLTLPAEQLVPGDVVLLSAGSLVPADGVLLAAKDCFVTQAALTGETFPVEKQPGVAPAAASLAERANCLFMGTSLRSGTARLLIARTGAATAFGAIAGRLRQAPPPTEFERGTRRFGYLLARTTLAMVLVVLAINVGFGRSLIEALMFSVALAVGLSPELLPAIMTITLAHGARRLARRGVIVRRLAAIENLGSMDVLCTDKTGTLTEGAVRLVGALDGQGIPARTVVEAAYLNAALQTGIVNPLDAAIVAAGAPPETDLAAYRKLDEVPYDFIRKRLSVAVATPGGLHVLLTKGAFASVLEICTRWRQNGAERPLDEMARAALQARFAGWSRQGLRVLGVASRTLAEQAAYGVEDETELVFEGFLSFEDPPKPGIEATLDALRSLGVQLKIITGDNRLVAEQVARAVGIAEPRSLSGRDINALGDEAFWHRAARTDLFVEVDPNQKERIILALKRTGHVVGYLGDGINDAPALHAADVGISVDNAVDVAKEAADLVLLEPDLAAVSEGVVFGRTTFANSLKYLYSTISANFGNMLSMALASLALPFLPLLPTQILLNNFLSDLPAMGIASDAVDADAIAAPHRWDVTAIRDFMLLFGPLSSVFDLLTFGTLWWLTDAVPSLFRSGWFVESLLTELLVLLVVRTHRPFHRSRPGRLLLGLTLVLVPVTLALPYLPIATALGFAPLPARVLGAMVLITLAYVSAAELLKRRFFARLERRAPDAEPESHGA